LCAVALLLGVDWLLVTSAKSSIAERTALTACAGTSASGVTLSLFTPLLVIVLTLSALLLAIRDLWLSERRGLRHFAALGGSVVLTVYVVGFLTGLVAGPPRHPCLRSEHFSPMKIQPAKWCARHFMGGRLVA